jgi:hypothetical protein
VVCQGLGRTFDEFGVNLFDSGISLRMLIKQPMVQPAFRWYWVT